MSVIRTPFPCPRPGRARVTESSGYSIRATICPFLNRKRPDAGATSSAVVDPRPAHHAQ
jgi:hypothetical protein